MLTLGALAFAAPLALIGLAVLPAIWWLLRVTPPTPAQVTFPPIRFLASLASTDESAARTPPWLIVLRLLLGLAVILGAAHPLINTGGTVAGSGPLVLIVDDGWAAANDWGARRDRMAGLVDLAEREKRSVVLVTTASAGSERQPERQQGGVRLMTASEARTAVQGLEPKPWATDRRAAIDALLELSRDANWPPGEVVWLSDGLDQSRREDSVGALGQSLRPIGKVTVAAPPAVDTALALLPPEAETGALRFTAIRATAGTAMVAPLRAISEEDGVLATGTVSFADGALEGTGSIELPAELLARLTRVEVEGEDTAGAVVLIDDRWRRRPVGLAVEGDGTADRPLVGDVYYLERALAPSAEVRRGTIDQLLARELAVLVMADTGRLERSKRESVLRWVDDGGILLRFAGPRLARGTRQEDPLLPVRLRGGDRAIGGALAWRSPASLAPFGADSPFFGLTIPDDVRVTRQVLAEPSLDPAERTWARLDDGTPLISAKRMGEGWLVLVHTTSTAEWSNLALSGLFVDVMNRIVALSRGVVDRADGPPLPPLETLDGFGTLGAASPAARSVAADGFDETVVGRAHPPGFYGTAAHRRALNLSATLSGLKPLGPLPESVTRVGYGGAMEIDLRPWLLGAALFLAVLDMALSLALRGLMRFAPRSPGRQSTGLAVVLGIALASALASGSASAQTVVADGSAEAASLTTRLAYIQTGDPEIDAVSRAGLAGLGTIVNRRTAVELGPPMGVNPETDELVFYPLLYWPLHAGMALPSPDAARRLEAYMRNGGTILFDTRRRGGGRSQGLRQLARELDLPSLVPVPAEHVLGRSYYLLSEFPGRWNGDTVWIEPGGEHVNDGVTSVVAGSHDWAGAWALDDDQHPMFAVVPGGDRQREMAYRFGVNVVMHVLTGSYKADQVHLPAIIERLGQ